MILWHPPAPVRSYVVESQGDLGADAQNSAPSEAQLTVEARKLPEN